MHVIKLNLPVTIHEFLMHRNQEDQSIATLALIIIYWIRDTHAWPLYSKGFPTWESTPIGARYYYQE